MTRSCVWSIPKAICTFLIHKLYYQEWTLIIVVQLKITAAMSIGMVGPKNFKTSFPRTIALLAKVIGFVEHSTCRMLLWRRKTCLQALPGITILNIKQKINHGRGNIMAVFHSWFMRGQSKVRVIISTYILSIRWHKHPCCQIGQHGLFHQTHHRDPEQWPAILPVTFSVLPPAFCWWWASQWSIILMSQTWILQGMSTLQIRKSQPCKQFLTYSNLLYWSSLRKWDPLTWTCTWNFPTDINGHTSNLVLSG